MNTKKLRELLDGYCLYGRADIREVLEELPALLDRLEKLEAVVEAVKDQGRYTVRLSIVMKALEEEG